MVALLLCGHFISVVPIVDMSCPMCNTTCQFGYMMGSNGCPTCDMCMQPCVVCVVVFSMELFMNQ